MNNSSDRNSLSNDDTKRVNKAAPAGSDQWREETRDWWIKQTQAAGKQRHRDVLDTVIGRLKTQTL